ncbi:hypothetical protein HJD18_14320 [Thermoleophilia bacterium SCSIO 60948]|nr:hypothetical protein HJD18_14320 [Thermoleophilia bacterium SCSIO 60948]
MLNGPGLDIADDGVTIDLNGKKLIGPAGSYYGIDSNEYDGLVVKNGTLEGWDSGIYGYYSSRMRLSDLEINLGGTNDDYGVFSQYAVDVKMNKVTVDNASYGFYLYSIDGLKLTDSKVTGSDDSTTYGLYDYNTVGTVDNLRANGAYYGAYVGGETGGYRILDSKFNNAGYAGAYVSNSTPLYRYRYTLTKNTANNAGTYGFYAGYDTRGAGNRATGAGTQDCRSVPCVN